jgi:hypothetical protein
MRALPRAARGAHGDLSMPPKTTTLPVDAGQIAVLDAPEVDTLLKDAVRLDRIAAGDPVPAQRPGDPVPPQRPGDPVPAQRPGDPVPAQRPGDPVPSQRPGDPVPAERPGDPVAASGHRRD